MKKKFLKIVFSSMILLLISFSQAFATSIIPAMTSSTTPLPYVISPSAAYVLFDGNISVMTYSFTNTTGVTVDCGSGNEMLVTGISCIFSNGAAGSSGYDPTSVTLKASNDNSTWTTLYTHSLSGGNGTFSFTNSVKYRYYKVTFGNNSSGGPFIKLAEIVLDGTPNTLPTAPSNFSYSNLSSSSASLSWSSVSDASGYYLYRNDVLIQTINNKIVTSFTDSSLTPNTDYTYKIVAFNTSGTSSPVSLSVHTSSVIPSTPTNLTTTRVNHEYVSLSWSPVLYADGYKVYKNGALVATVTDTQSEVHGLVANTEYNFQVSAYSSAGESAKSQMIFVTTLAVEDTTPPPNASDFKADSVGINSVKLTWFPATSEDFKGYVLYRSDGNLVELPSSATSYIDSNLSPSTEYTYTLKSCDTSNNLSNGVTYTIKTLDAPISVPTQTINTGTDVSDIVKSSNSVMAANGFGGLLGFSIAVGVVMLIAYGLVHFFAARDKYGFSYKNGQLYWKNFRLSPEEEKRRFKRRYRRSGIKVFNSINEGFANAKKNGWKGFWFKKSRNSRAEFLKFIKS